MRALIAPVALLLAGCPPDPEVLDPIGTWTEPAAPTAFRIAPVTAARPARVIVRAVDDWGVAVPADTVEVVLDGASEIVRVDDLGFGVLEVAEVGAHEVSASGVTVDVIVLDAATPLQAQPAAVAQDVLVEVLPAARGAVGRSETSVWWLPASGDPIEVLTAPDGRTIDGLAVGHVDDDGVTDAIVWSADTVHVLRGHPFGGFGLTGSIVASNRIVGGADLGDADGDGITDIAIAWTSEARHELEVWRGDGAWGFAGAEPIRLRVAPHDLSIGENTGEGRPQITLLDASRVWTRYVASGPSWSLTGPAVEGLAFLPGATSVSGEFDGDGAEELFVVAPFTGTGQREIAMFDLTGEEITFTRVAPDGGRVALGDGDRDGLVDLWMLEADGDLFVRSFDGVAQQQRRVWSPPETGPIAVTDLDGDGVSELLVAGPAHWAWTWGGLGTFDGGTWWTPGEGETLFDLGLSLPALPAVLDDEETVAQFVGIAEDGATLSFVVWSVFLGPTPVDTPVGEILLASDGTEPVDLALCGDVAYALTTSEVLRIELDGTTPRRAGRHSSSGQRVACGDGPGGSVAGVLDDGEVRLFDADMGLLVTQPAGGAEAIALVGGDIVSCTEPGCDVARWDYGGGVVSVVSEGGLLTFGDGTVLPGAGRLQVQDIDGDGFDDLLAHDGGTIVIVRSSGDGFGVERVVSTTLDLDGPVSTLDLYGRGDLVLVGTRAGALVASSGYTPVPPGD